MARRKSSGNPLTKGLSRVIDKVAPEVLDDVLDVATGPKKGSKKAPESRSRSDWATRAPAAERRGSSR